MQIEIPQEFMALATRIAVALDAIVVNGNKQNAFQEKYLALVAEDQAFRKRMADQSAEFQLRSEQTLQAFLPMLFDGRVPNMPSNEALPSNSAPPRRRPRHNHPEPPEAA